MELFLSPDDPQRTIFVSSNGVAHYRVRTFKTGGFAGAGRRYSTTIQRNADSEEEALVAEIEWKSLGTSTMVRSVLLEEVAVKAKDFLYKRNQFSRSRYFLGNDGQEYRWKLARNGIRLTECSTNKTVARFVRGQKGQGIFSGQRKACLRIYPALILDIDLVVLSFLIMEKKRCDQAGDGTTQNPHDEEPTAMDGGEC